MLICCDEILGVMHNILTKCDQRKSACSLAQYLTKYSILSPLAVSWPFYICTKWYINRIRYKWGYKQYMIYADLSHPSISFVFDIYFFTNDLSLQCLVHEYHLFLPYHLRISMTSVTKRPVPRAPTDEQEKWLSIFRGLIPEANGTFSQVLLSELELML